MAAETRTMPGRITGERNGEAIASGWCLVAYETGVRHEPLDEWRGEMACTDADARKAIAAAEGTTLHLHLDPYGGEFEPWHGPVTAVLVDEALDPDARRITLTSAGPLIRFRQGVEEKAAAKA
ncbi:MAG: hypothetical protein H0V47_01300 [Chloroflexia bacterium]|nr:hypothetical protein [Chloroflexia bacterium]